MMTNPLQLVPRKQVDQMITEGSARVGKAMAHHVISAFGEDGVLSIAEVQLTGLLTAAYEAGMRDMLRVVNEEGTEE